MASLNSDTMSDQCCTRLVFEAVKENSVSKFSLAESTYDPLELLASLVHCNDNGETPLMIAIKGENNSFVRNAVTNFLSRECFYLHEESLMMTQYSFAIEQLAHQISMVEFVEFFFHDSYATDWLEIIVQTLFKSTTLKRQDKINALELIGATLMFRFLRIQLSFRHDQLVLLGLKCWTEAMTLRYFPAYGEPLLPKIPDVSVPSVASSAVFGSAVEVKSMEELNLLESNFKRDLFSDNPLLTCEMSMKIQALLTLRRICSQANHGQPCSLYLESLFDFGFDCIIGRNIKDCKLCINTCLIILDEMTGFDPKMLSPESFVSFKNALGLISDCFIEMLSNDGREELSYTHLLAPTKFISTIAKFFLKPAMISSVSFMDYIQGRFFNFNELVFRLLLVLESISPRLSSQEKQQLEEYYSIYIQNLFPERTTTVLHAAVYNIQEYNLRFRNAQQLNIKPIKLILKLGADPNAIDKYGQTPLHIFGLMGFGFEMKFWNENLPVFQALVDAGGHLDMATDDGQTVISILKQSLQNLKNRGSIVHPYYESRIKTVFPLSCYCARVIRRNGIRFDEDRLPIHLQEFVTQHSARPSAAQDLIDLPRRPDSRP